MSYQVKRQFKQTYLSALVTSLLIAPAANAQPNFVLLDNPTFLPWHPHVRLDGNAGTVRALGGEALIPLYGGDNGLVFTDVEGKFGTDNGWFAGFGGGFRRVINDKIWGLYVFGDRNTTPYKQDFWFVSPGLEVISNHWNAHVNVYIPTTKHKVVKTGFLGENIGRPGAVSFSQHSQFDDLFDKVEEVGTGVDAVFEHDLPTYMPSRIYIGGYYYHFDNIKAVRGVQAGLRVPILKRFEATVADSYDNIQGNVATVGLAVHFGGMPRQTVGTLSSHLLDNTFRHLGTLERGDATRSGKFFRDSGEKVLVRDNIYFFTANGGKTFNAANTTQNCTAEHPCNETSFNQASLNSIAGFAPQANLYLNQGTFDVTDEAGNRLNINPGLAVYGRTSDYRMAASTSGQLPVIQGLLALQGNNFIDSLRLRNNAIANNAAINIIGANDISINNSTIGDETGNGSYIEAVHIENSTGIQLNNVTANAYMLNGVGGPGARAIHAITNSSVTINNSTINARHDINNATGNVESVYGILAESSSLTINNSTISATSNVTATDPAGAYFVYGVYNFYPGNPTPLSHTTINNSTITANGTSSDGIMAATQTFSIFSVQARGVTKIDNSNLNLNLNGNGNIVIGYDDNGSEPGSVTQLTNSTINLNTKTNTGQGLSVIGADVSSAVNNTLDGVAININNAGGSGVRLSTGIAVRRANTTVNISNSNITINSSSDAGNATSVGVLSENAPTVINVNNSTFNLSASSGNGNAASYGIVNAVGAGSVITVRDSTFDLKATKGGAGGALAAASFGVVDLDGSNTVTTEVN